jgi:polar amino acid transport system permease protein
MIHDLTWNSIAYLLMATRWTIALALVSFVGGGLGGLALTALSVAPSRILRIAVACYIQIVEGVPLLMLLFLSYFGVALIGYKVDAWITVSLALSIYASAFLADIWIGSIRTVPKAQWEAAQSMALGFFHTLWFVIFPQALRIATPPTVGFLVQLVKGTALASIVGFVELTRSGQVLNNLTFKPFTIYAIVGSLYFLMCWPLSLLSRRLEDTLAAPYKR